MVFKIIKIILPFLLISSIAFSQDDMADRLTGHWSGEGLLFGKPAKFVLHWEPVLDGQFYKLSFQNSTNGTEYVFKAEAYYAITSDSTAQATWFDNRGVQQTITSTIAADQLTSIWQSSTEKGKTTYHLTSDHEMKVIDYVWKNDQWTKFGEAKYIKGKE